MTNHQESLRDYSVYGLKVRSSLLLPELFPASADVAPDVTIELGSIPEVDGADGISMVDGALILVIEDVARYRISGGNRITVDSRPGVPERNVRLFLLGSAFGALLHQRGLLPLHANAVEIGGKAVAFMGESGAGKSTLAAWFHDHGYRVLADDVCVVRHEDDGHAYVAAGLPRLRLWRDTLEVTRRMADQFQRSYVGETPYEKFDVPTGSVVDGDLELAALFELVRGDDFSLDKLTGIELLNSVYAHTYRGAFVSVVSKERTHWSVAVRLARSVPFFRVTRPWDLAKLDRDVRRILEYGNIQLGLAL